MTAPGLIADIGGTNARFALVDRDGRVSEAKVMPCAAHRSPAAAAKAYLDGLALEVRPARGAFAVASPIEGDRIRLTNHDWDFSIEATRTALGLDRLRIVNDFVAVALAVPRLSPADTAIVAEGRAQPGRPLAVLGPGTGLGVSTLVPGADGRWQVLPGEGGHATMAARTDREAEIIAWLRRRDDHVSVEDLVSGPGLANIHRALSALAGAEGDAIANPARISEGAAAGDPRCRETFALFFAMLGTAAGNIALTTGARGGVVLAGGILPRMIEDLRASAFLERFRAKGRFTDYLSAIPISVITHPFPAFTGLAGLVGPD